MKDFIPRILISGLGGDSGKTFATCGLIKAISRSKGSVSAWKKGPDYIDPAWLSLASGRKARNLDTFLMDNSTIKSSFVNGNTVSDIAIIEGNRGLFDGFDDTGKHSTAELAKILDMPVIVVINVTKSTRTVAAILLGLINFDPNLKIAGVILNRVAGKRHESVIRDSIKASTNLPIIGAIPSIEENILPSRHLGLVTPDEHSQAMYAIDKASEIISKYVNLDLILEIADKAGQIKFFDKSESILHSDPILCQDSHTDQTKEIKKIAKIGYFKDRAFSFYYPENLEALVAEGAQLVGISSLTDSTLGNIDGLYIGGGFPETNVVGLSNNKLLISELRQRSQSGMPIYAECGGLMYLCDNLIVEGTYHKMCGIFPANVRMSKKPIGHGYAIMKSDVPNPWFHNNEEITGHEFHYSAIEWTRENNQSIMALEVIRGKGAINGRDGLLKDNTFGTYLHIHSLGSKNWAKNFVKAVVENSNNRIYK